MRINTDYKELRSSLSRCEREFESLQESIEMSYHAARRARERLGLKAKSAERETVKAFTDGLTAEDLTSRERDYLVRKGLHGCSPRVYNGSCYIFSENMVCVTVYKLPAWFGKRQFFDGKTKIRNPKNYYRHYGVMA